MLACPPNLTYSFLTVCEIITFKVDRKVFSTVPEGYNRVLEAKKTIFGGIFGIFLFKLLFIGELGTCPKTSYVQEVWNFKKKMFFHKEVC
jgi:hypothetical protein